MFQLSYNNQQFDPLSFTKNDFASFEGLDMNQVIQMSQYANNIANNRLDALNKERSDFIEKTKLNKRFSDLEQSYLNKLNSIIDNSSNLQLSDNANYNKLNTEIIRLKNDPVLREALYTTEKVKQYSELREKDPSIIDKYWSNPNEKNYHDFINGKTDQFEFNPIYKDYDYHSVVDEFMKSIPESEKESIKKYGINAIYTMKESGKGYDTLVEKAKSLKEDLLKNNPDSKFTFQRMINAGINPDILLDKAIESSANKYSSSKVNLGNISVDPNVTANQHQQQINISKSANSLNWEQFNYQKQQDLLKLNSLISNTGSNLQFGIDPNTNGTILKGTDGKAISSNELYKRFINNSRLNSKTKGIADNTNFNQYSDMEIIETGLTNNNGSLPLTKVRISNPKDKMSTPLEIEVPTELILGTTNNNQPGVDFNYVNGELVPVK